jgi:hypothetical protein
MKADGTGDEGDVNDPPSFLDAIEGDARGLIDKAGNEAGQMRDAFGVLTGR